jgi:hypothetical protein
MSAQCQEIDCKSEVCCEWKQGPLPPDTYYWGGVVRSGDDPKMGFYFAGFNGDHAVITKPDGTTEKLTPHQVGWFNDCLRPPQF